MYENIVGMNVLLEIYELNYIIAFDFETFFSK